MVSFFKNKNNYSFQEIAQQLLMECKPQPLVRDPLAQAIQDANLYPELERQAGPSYNHEAECHKWSCAEKVITLLKKIEDLEKQLTSTYQKGYRNIRKENKNLRKDNELLQAKLDRAEAEKRFWQQKAMSFMH